jgi:hypothetical protein
MKHEDVFDEISSALDTKLSDEESNPYGAVAYNFIPNTFPNNQFPIIVLSQLDYTLSKETLDKEEREYTVSIEANIFAIDTPTTHKRLIANDVCELVFGVIDGYGLRLDMRDVLPNLQENVYRIVMRFSGRIDENRAVIYRE